MGTATWVGCQRSCSSELPACCPFLLAGMVLSCTSNHAGGVRRRPGGGRGFPDHVRDIEAASCHLSLPLVSSAHSSTWGPPQVLSTAEVLRTRKSMVNSPKLFAALLRAHPASLQESAMSAAKQVEKLEKRLKELLRLPDNKRCANCEAQVGEAGQDKNSG